MKVEKSCISKIVNSFNDITSKPEDFISAERSIADNIKQLLKQTYDFTKDEAKSFKSNALPELIIENFDLEQIWQQIELQNDYILNQSVSVISKLLLPEKKLLFDEKLIEDENKSEQEIPLETTETNKEDVEESGDEIESKSDIDSDDENSPKTFKRSAVDDKFFKLAEMNNYLLSEEKNMNKHEKNNDSGSDSEESIDMFKMDCESEKEDEDNGETNNKRKNPRFKDFFGTKTQRLLERQRAIIQENEIEDEPDENGEIDDNEANDTSETNLKSSLEMREERLQYKIKELEHAALSAKPWQLTGEVTAESRPQNSLLQEVLEFDVSTRPAPVITEATTQVLEDVIRQRIKDKVFDDVERKIKPVDTPLEYKKKLLLDQEKSKQSLAQIYEKEYVDQREALNSNEDKEEEEPNLHKEIKTMMHNLFAKLDALSNFHFTPKPAAPEVKIVSNLPAISMEEVAPVATSDATLLAPEEIKNKSKSDIIGKGERTNADKNRERRKKKRKQKEHAKHITQKTNVLKKPGLGNKYSKAKVKKMLEHVVKDTNVDKMDESYGSKSIKSSSAFFTQLQDEAKSYIKTKSKTKANRKFVNTFDAKKLKL